MRTDRLIIAGRIRRTRAATGLALLALGGCRAVHAPAVHDPGRAGGVGDDPALVVEASAAPGTGESPWPARWGDDPDRRGIVIEMDPSQRLRSVHYSRYHQGRTKPSDQQDAARLASELGVEGGFNFRVEGPGSFIFSADTRSDEPASDPPDLAFRFVSAQRVEPVEPSADATRDHVELQRTWFTYRDPKEGRETVGTLVLLPGMFGTPEPVIDATERYFVSKGYGVLRMRSHPSRYTQHLMLSYLDGKGDEVAELAAEAADQRVAECAYSVDTALDHVLGQRASMRDLPVVLMGMSGGAMALPSVFAYAPDRYDAAVLIAGGANFLRIMIESNYKSWIDAILVDFDPGSPALGTPDPGVVDTLASSYLARSRLDAYHTAPMLREHGVPTLVLHATTDKAVPASSGDLLHERLGSPERWSYPFGHELIFVGLPTQMPKVETWLRDQLRDDDGHEMSTR